LKHTVQVTLLGQKYTVRSETAPDEVAQVAAFVNSRIAEVSSTSRVVDTLNTVVLTLLNVAGDYLRLQKSDTLGEERLQRLLARLDGQPATSDND
jgi:cell division protein ZapA